MSSWGDGDDTTLTSLIQAMLIHGMVVMGGPKVRYCYSYGVSAIGKPKKADLTACKALGKRIVEYLKVTCKRKEN